MQHFHLTGHSARLQSMRGLAALAVALGHCFLTFTNGRLENPDFHLTSSNALLALGEVLFQANTAVIFFYVLSGLVLGESLRRRAHLPFRQRFAGFVVRRLCRLYPAMWASIAVAIGAIFLVVGAQFPGATQTFNGMLTHPMSVASVIRNLIGIDTDLNPLLWSVQIELILIVVLPFMVAMSARLPLAIDAVIFAFLVLVSLKLWNPSPNVLRYVYCFQLGIMLPKMMASPTLRAFASNGYVATTAALLLLPFDYFYDSGSLWLPYKFVADTLICAQLIAFVLLRQETRASRLLEMRPLVWLGDVSYSFYVYSMSSQVILGFWLLNWFGLTETRADDLTATMITILLAILTVTMATILAAFSFAWVERPFIALGKDWSARAESYGAPRTNGVGGLA